MSNKAMDVMELEGAEGGDIFYLALGIHDPALFMAEVPGLSNEERAEVVADGCVKHECWTNTGPRDGYDNYYEPSAGEPNATAYIP